MTRILNLNNKSTSAAWSGRSESDEQVQLWSIIDSFAYLPVSPYPRWCHVSAGWASKHTTNICHMQYLLLHPAEPASPYHLSADTQEENCEMECFLSAEFWLRVFFLFLSLPLNWYLTWKGGKVSHLCSPKSQNAALSFSTWNFLHDATLSYFLLVLSVNTPKGIKTSKAEQKGSRLTHNNLLFRRVWWTPEKSQQSLD